MFDLPLKQRIDEVESFLSPAIVEALVPAGPMGAIPKELRGSQLVRMTMAIAIIPNLKYLNFMGFLLGLVSHK
jgi:hypothetical protein